MKLFRIIAIVAGAALTFAAVKAITFAVAVNRGIESWGKPHVAFREKARQEILDVGLKIPSEARFPYYYVDGFMNHTFFIAFTVSPEAAEAVVKDYAKVGFEAFEPLTYQLPPASSGLREAEYRTPFYNVDHLKDAIIYFDRSAKTHGFHFIYDRATWRLYFCDWGT